MDLGDQRLLADAEAYLAATPAVAGCVVYRIDATGRRNAAAAGLADPNTGRPMTVDATFRIASCTKTFTAATVLRLIEDGRIGIHDDVTAWIDPDHASRLPLGGVTVHHLLQHTSGLPDMDGQEFMNELYTYPDKVWTPWEKIERSLIGRDRIGPLGLPARYSDVGYIVLAMLIEHVTGTGIQEAFRSHLRFDDLGLNVIHLESLEDTPPQAGSRVRHFVEDRDVTDIHPSCDLWGAGGLVSDAHDLAEWWHALFSGRVFRHDETLATMLTTVPEPSAGRDMGLGIYKRTIADQTIWAHGGWWGAYPLHNQTTGTTACVLVTQCLDHTGERFSSFAYRLVLDSTS